MPRKRKPKPLLKQWWIDHEGRTWRVPNVRDRLRPHQIKGHAALRAFVFCRDGGRCVRCGSSEELPDHIVSRRNGGSHHPSNLQCLCKRCNDRKSNYEDRGRAYDA